jgi:AcrR family transcriptional regulator
VFLERGYEGASMADIAHAAEVSKGTLYAHFMDKRTLFAEVIQDECDRVRSQHFIFDEQAPLREALTALGVGFLSSILEPDARALHRTMVAEAHRSPDLGAIFMSSGPEAGAKSLSALLDAAVLRGELAIPDTDLAASQFIEMCDAGLSLRAHMGKGEPSPALIEAHVKSAVSLFLKGYAIPSFARC